MSTLDPALQIDKGCVLITEAGHFFSCSDVTISKAMLIYHHYQKVRQQWELHFFLYATASFTLSVQVCQEKLKMKDIVDFFNSIGTYSEVPKRPDLEKIRGVQFDIIKVVFGNYYHVAASKRTGLGQKCDTAHRFVFYYMNEFSSIPEIKNNIISIKTMCLKLVNNFYHCYKSISYTPLVICWAAMFFAFQTYLISIENIRVIKQELSTAVQSECYRNAIDDMLLVTEVATRSLA